MKTLLFHLVDSVIVLVSLAVAAPAAAQSFSVAANNTVTQPGGIRYAVGGVGLDTRAEMQRLAASHNLLVKFASIGGEFLIPDSVSVRKGNMDVLNMSDSGPLLYVSLPNGTYTVLATYQGVVRSKIVNVSARTPDVVLTWPVQAQ